MKLRKLCKTYIQYATKVHVAWFYSITSHWLSCRRQDMSHLNAVSLYCTFSTLYWQPLCWITEANRFGIEYTIDFKKSGEIFFHSFCRMFFKSLIAQSSLLFTRSPKYCHTCSMDWGLESSLDTCQLWWKMVNAVDTALILFLLGVDQLHQDKVLGIRKHSARCNSFIVVTESFLN